MFILKFISGGMEGTYVRYCMITPHSCILKNGKLIEALRFDTTEDAESLRNTGKKAHHFSGEMNFLKIDTSLNSYYNIGKLF